MESTPLTSASDPNVCRVLPHLVADGATQMARDEALLDAVAEGRSPAAVRTYEWSVPTLSLGYFQSFREVAHDPRWRGVPVVRRATGGGALWHDREITYAVVVPRTHPLAHPSSALYRAVHEAIASHLRGQGWLAERRQAVSVDDATPPAVASSRPFLCFRDRDDQDVVIGPTKVVGSAQRRRAGAVLQHGSILLARSAMTPELPGLVDLDRPGTRAVAISAAALVELLVATLGKSALSQDWTDFERERSERLIQGCYAARAWTERR